MTHHSIQVLQKDFFISYTNADRAWAEWIAWHLNNANFSTILRPVGLRLGDDFAQEVPGILKQAKRILVVLSRDYLYMLYSQLNWALLLRKEAIHNQGLFLLVHVRECRNALKSIVGSVDFVDLADNTNESEASQKLLAAVQKKSGEFTISDVSFQVLSDTTERALIHKQLSFLRQHDMLVNWQKTDLVPNDGIRLPIKNLPEERNNFFSDREGILEDLYHIFSSNTSSIFPVPLALSGLGGIGKTQIALEYAYRFADEYQYTLWVRSSSRESLVHDFVHLSELLRLRERSEQNHNEIVIAVKRWLQSNAGWLLIFDSVEDLEAISDFIPIGGKGHILLTTRFQDLGTIAQYMVVDTLDPRAGATLLLRRTHTIALDAEFYSVSQINREQAEEISKRMGGLPLALDQAGAYINKHAWSLQKYLECYDIQSLELLKERGSLPFSHPEPVVTTWLLSFKKVTQANPLASELLCLCAFLSPDQIPEEILTKGSGYLGPSLASIATDPIKLDDAIMELRKLSFISRNPIMETLRVHELVQAVLREMMSDDEQRTWAKRAVQAIHLVFPEDTENNEEACETYISHAIACAQHIKKWDLEFLEAEQLLHRAGEYLLNRGRYRESMPLYQQALTIRQQIFGPSDPDVATLYNDLGWLHRTLSKYEEARKLFDQALEIRESRASQREVAQTLNDLAWLSYNEGKYNEALYLNQRALAIRESLKNDSDLATSLNNLAWIYYVLGNYTDAETLFLRANDIRQQIQSEPSFSAIILDNLARLYRTQGKYQDAKEFYEKGLEIRRRVKGAEHPDVALSLTGLGYLAYCLGKYDEAERLYEQALAIREQAHGPDDPRVAQVLTHQGKLYRVQGKYRDAKRKYERALAIRENRSENDHPDMAYTLRHLARLYRSLGEYEKAENTYLRALDIREKAFRETIHPDEHPDIAQILNDLGSLYIEQGRYDNATDFLSRALKIREGKLGKEHLDVAETLTSQGKLYFILGRYYEALKQSERAHSIWTNKFGSQHPQHPYLADILNNRGQIYVAQGLYIEAEQIYREALQIQQEALGTDHPDIAQTLNNLAQVYVISSRYSEAQSSLDKALAIRKKVLGDDHPYIAFSLDILTDMHLAQKDFEQAAVVIDQAIAIREQKLGSNHIALANSICKRGDIYFEQGDYLNARLFYERSYRVRIHRLGPKHVSIAASLYRMASVYESLGDNEQAEKNYEQAIAIYEHLEGYNLPDMVVAMEQYANFLLKVGKRHLVTNFRVRARNIQSYLTATQKIPPSHYKLRDLKE